MSDPVSRKNEEDASNHVRVDAQHDTDVDAAGETARPEPLYPRFSGDLFVDRDKQQSLSSPRVGLLVAFAMGDGEGAIRIAISAKLCMV